MVLAEWGGVPAQPPARTGLLMALTSWAVAFLRRAGLRPWPWGGANPICPRPERSARLPGFAGR